jgi:hypothetical protein
MNRRSVNSSNRTFESFQILIRIGTHINGI